MEDYKRVLIISANPLSTTDNNGKTIASFFDTYPKEMLAQLYFAPSLPNSPVCNCYYKISDMDMLKSRLHQSNRCGEVVENGVNDTHILKDANTVKNIKKGNIFRFFRELMWNCNWQTEELFLWLDNFNPEIIFFVGGDAIFSYKICFFIQKRYNTKLAFYLTDDYVLPRWSLSAPWWLRRNWILKYMRKAVKDSDVFFTISPTMREQYNALFSKDSYVISNLFFSKDKKKNCKDVNNNEVLLVYAGGLHLNRIKVLIQLANAVNLINTESSVGKKIKLEVYSTQSISEQDKVRLNEGGDYVWGGPLMPSQLENKLIQADYLVHVESFDYKNKCNTRLSLSTKIPEYMSYKRPIIAIGPKGIASMDYLSECAYCVNDYKNLKTHLKEILDDPGDKNEMVENAYKKYILNHDKKKKQEEFINIIVNL